MSEGDTINVVVKKASAGTPPIATAAGEREGGEERGLAIAGIDANNDSGSPHLPADSDSGRALLGVAGAGAIVGTIVIGGLITGPVIVGGAAMYASQRGRRINKIVKEGGAKIADAAGATHRAAKQAGSVTLTKKNDILVKPKKQVL